VFTLAGRLAMGSSTTFGRTAGALCRLLTGASILACTLCANSFAQTPQHLPEPVDLRASATDAAARGRMLLVLFSETGCQYCERLRREYLLPMQRNAEVQQKLAFFQVDVNADTALRDFAGQPTTQAALARRYGIRIMPTVMLLGSNGETLAEPLVGFTSSDFYGAYLDERISAARANLAGRKSGRLN